MDEKKGGKGKDGTPGVVVEPLPQNFPVVFDRKTYQREYMRRYRAAGRDKSRTPAGNERGKS